MGEPWRVLEFYSGIGGMRYSLIKSGIRGEVIQAFDINDIANDVYEHNFGHRPYQGNIQSLTAIELDKYGAHAWLLSPPCQPYTRQGLQKHSADARAFSFIKILELIPHMLQPPRMLLVENVVGFETSDTHEQMLEIFSNTGFATQEFILSPLQFGIPYSRPRYFCLAKRKPTSFQNQSFNSQLLWTPFPLLKLESITSGDGHHFQEDRLEESGTECQPVRNFLEAEAIYNQHAECVGLNFCHEPSDSILHCEDGNTNASTEGSATNIRRNIYITTDTNGEKIEGRDTSTNVWNKYMVPLSLIERWGSAMDIVYPDSKRCCCFTKSYYRYVKGTGSLLSTSEVSDHESAKKPDVCFLKELGLRYFTPREVANLHSYPEDFHFPPHISIRQQYALLGNSLSIAVVAPLLRYLFTEPP